MKKVKVATVWLDGCSGCHMSLLDMDAAIIALARRIDIVYGPLVDAQEFPEDVDVTLVEGAVSSQEEREQIQKIRQRTQDADRAGRLRGDRQRAGDAQCDSRSASCCSAMYVERRRSKMIPERPRCRQLLNQAGPCTSLSRSICSCRAVRRQFEVDCGSARRICWREEA